MAHKDGFVSVRDYTKKVKVPSLAIIVELFGSWSNALKECGIPDPKEKILEDIKIDCKWLEKEVRRNVKRNGG